MITENIKARKCADEIFDFAEEQAEAFAGDARTRYWQRFVERVLQMAEPVLDTCEKPSSQHAEPMDDAEAKFFGRRLISFGMHQGKRVDDVPMSYLLWLDSQPDFRRDLRRYLASDRIQREQPTLEPD